MGAARSLPGSCFVATAALHCGKPVAGRLPARRCGGDNPCDARGNRLDPQRLEVEITEGVLFEDFERALAILRRIKGLGVRIAMDDFGTGYSSLSYLQDFPFDKIKIDQTFISRIGDSFQAGAIIHAILRLGRTLALPVIAEGVETEEQRAFLAREGCQIQGYLIGRPEPIAHYQHLVAGLAGARENSAGVR
jgi:EAL domain-containing protein (putative c-di-GMP-specific phosphodiesterase class I)